ncbi:FAD binding domain-containing protein [Biscogniauxia marginata]|nr:FAD binding domain-containing protein [Biscogniauxia marginata]
MLKTCISAAAATLLAGIAAASAELSSNSSFVPGDVDFGPRVGNSGILPCEALKDAGLGDRLVFATDPGYEPQILTWFTENSRMRPYYLVLLQNTEEVSTALTTLVNTNDGASDWHIAVRSGGHSSIGSNNIDKGKNVYADQEKDGVTVAGGRDGDVGVGRFLLGGGNSFFTGRMGFGCDSVVNFEVVLANGTIVNANSTANMDLWQGLKGGTSNFGIVTRFDIEAIPSRAVPTVLIYTSEPSMSTRRANGNATTGFDGVKDLPVIFNVTTLQSMADAALGSQVPGSGISAGSTLTFQNNPRMARRCVDIFVEYVEMLKHSIGADNFTTGMFLQPIPSYIGTIGQKRGGNMLGLDHVQENALLWTTGSSGNTAEAHAVAQAGLNVMAARLKELSRSMDADLDFIYLNYADANQGPLRSYGLINIQHLRDVAAKYDPAGVFQKRISGGFKLSMVV